MFAALRLLSGHQDGYRRVEARRPKLALPAVFRRLRLKVVLALSQAVIRALALLTLLGPKLIGNRLAAGTPCAPPLVQWQGKARPSAAPPRALGPGYRSGSGRHGSDAIVYGLRISLEWQFPSRKPQSHETPVSRRSFVDPHAYNRSTKDPVTACSRSLGLSNQVVTSLTDKQKPALHLGRFRYSLRAGPPTAIR